MEIMELELVHKEHEFEYGVHLKSMCSKCQDIEQVKLTAGQIADRLDKILDKYPEPPRNPTDGGSFMQFVRNLKVELREIAKD